MKLHDMPTQTQPMQPCHGVMPQHPFHGRLGGGAGRAAGAAACLLAVIGAGASPIDLVANGLSVHSGLLAVANGLSVPSGLAVANGLSVPSGSGLAGADNGIDCCDAVANGFGPSGLGAWNGLSGGFCCAEPPAHAGTS